MTTQTEALKLALEALEYYRYDPRHKNMHKMSHEAITAIKEALAQPEQEHITDGSHCWCSPRTESGVVIHNKEDNWQQYAKEGETAQQVIERTRADLDAFIKLYTIPPIHRESGMTKDELWMSNGKLRAELSDLKARSNQEPLQGAVNLQGVVTHVELGQEDDFCKEVGATRIYSVPVTQPAVASEQEPVACPSGPATSTDRYFYEQGYKAALRDTTPPTQKQEVKHDKR